MGWVKLRDNLISPLMELKSISQVADPDQNPPKKVDPTLHQNPDLDPTLKKKNPDPDPIDTTHLFFFSFRFDRYYIS